MIAALCEHVPTHTYTHTHVRQVKVWVADAELKMQAFHQVRLESLLSRSHIIRAAAGAVSAGSLNLCSITKAASPSDILSLFHLYPPETLGAVHFFILCPPEVVQASVKWRSFICTSCWQLCRLLLDLFPSVFKVLLLALQHVCLYCLPGRGLSRSDIDIGPIGPISLE